MQIKLDEDLGERGRILLSNAGHDVTTVADQGLQSATDQKLIDVSQIVYNATSQTLFGVVPMNADAHQLLNHFDQLPRDDQQDVAKEILRRTAELDVPQLSDDELIGQADELLLKLDEAEAADAEKS